MERVPRFTDPVDTKDLHFALQHAKAADRKNVIVPVSELERVLIQYDGFMQEKRSKDAALAKRRQDAMQERHANKRKSKQ